MEESYPEGMLDRDQRTAKIRIFLCGSSDIKVPKRTTSSTDRIYTAKTTPSSIINNSIDAKSKKTQFWYLIRKNGYSIQNLLRLKHVLLVLVYLTLVILPASFSAPVFSEMDGEWWNNPCKLDNPHSLSTLQDDAASDLKEWNFEELYTIAFYAYKQATEAKDEYARATFGREFDDLFLEKSSDWLPDLPKRYNEKIPDEHLQQMTLKSTIQKVYHDLQIIAVGIQQIITDEKRGGQFQKYFTYKEGILKSVLCELQEIMISMNIPFPEDVSKSVMPDEYRYNLDQTPMYRRNYFILKQYINTLDYFIQAINYFQCLQKKEQGSPSNCESNQLME